MPSPQYWVSGAALWIAGSFILSIIIAVIGIKEMVPSKLLVFLVGVAILLMFIGWWTTAEQEEAAARSKIDNADMRSDIKQIKEAMGIKPSEAAEEVTPKGMVQVLEAQKASVIEATKNNIPLFRVLEGDSSNPVGPIRVNLVSIGGPVFAINYWISPADNKGAEDPQYWSIDQRKALIPVVDSNSREWVRFLPPGNYLIEIDALTGHWNQYLSISREGNKIKQSIKVVREGVAIYTQEMIL